jgi:hypothetical protein
LRVIAELVDWCAAHGVARVADLTGALPAPPTPTPTPTDETREEPE